MARFRGTFQHNIDAKGRLSVPNRFRDVLRSKDDNRLVVTKGFNHDCLVVFPMDRWLETEEHVDGLPAGQAKDNFIRQFISPAQDCSLDKMGRVLIPVQLRAEVGLNREVMVVGALGKFEIWDKGRWEGYQQDDSAREKALELLNTQNIRF